MSAGEASPHVVGCLDLFIDIFLEVENRTYIQILILNNYIAHGPHLFIYFKQPHMAALRVAVLQKAVEMQK